MTEACNYVDDSTFHTCDLDQSRLNHDVVLAIESFESN